MPATKSNTTNNLIFQLRKIMISITSSHPKPIKKTMNNAMKATPGMPLNIKNKNGKLIVSAIYLFTL
jgi:hypothetical protein